MSTVAYSETTTAETATKYIIWVMPPGTHSTIAGLRSNITAKHVIQNIQHSPVSCLCHVKDHTGSTPPVILGFPHIDPEGDTKSRKI
jgi:hypothetical protein